MNDDIKFALSQRATHVWLLLIAATCLSWGMGRGTSPGESESTSALATLLIAIALVKVRLVIRFFMEVRDAPFTLRLLMDFWCAVLGVVLIALNWGVFKTTT